MIKAEAHSDDRVFEVDFDAQPWFERATDEQIIALAECGWGGDYPADDVARGMEDEIKDLGHMFAYIERKDGIGFECHVKAQDAITYLKAYRPALYEKIVVAE